MSLVEEYASNNEDLTAYVKSNGFNITGNTMSCPFHGSDSTPSLKINGHKWNCFGCGRGGGYLKFIHEISLLENHNVTYYDVIENYIRENQDLYIITNGTIYKSKEESFNEQWESAMDVATSTSYRPKKVEVRSTRNLLRKAKKIDTSIKINLLAGIQDGMPYSVLESIVNGTDLTGKSLLDIASM